MNNETSRVVGFSADRSLLCLISAHDAYFIAVLIHILGVFDVVWALVLYLAEALHIDHVVGLRRNDRLCRGWLRRWFWGWVLVRASAGLRELRVLRWEQASVQERIPGEVLALEFQPFPSLPVARF